MSVLWASLCCFVKFSLWLERVVTEIFWGPNADKLLNLWTNGAKQSTKPWGSEQLYWYKGRLWITGEHRDLTAQGRTRWDKLGRDRQSQRREMNKDRKCDMEPEAGGCMLQNKMINNNINATENYNSKPNSSQNSPESPVSYLPQVFHSFNTFNMFMLSWF